MVCLSAPREDTNANIKTKKRLDNSNELTGINRIISVHRSTGSYCPHKIWQTFAFSTIINGPGAKQKK